MDMGVEDSQDWVGMNGSKLEVLRVNGDREDSTATDDSDFTPEQMLAMRRGIKSEKVPLPRGVEDVGWQAPTLAGLEHSRAICNIKKSPDGRMTFTKLNKDQAHFRLWQQDNGTAETFGSRQVEKEVNGERLTVRVAADSSILALPPRVASGISASAAASSSSSSKSPSTDGSSSPPCASPITTKRIESPLSNNPRGGKNSRKHPPPGPVAVANDDDPKFDGQLVIPGRPALSDEARLRTNGMEEPAGVGTAAEGIPRQVEGASKQALVSVPHRPAQSTGSAETRRVFRSPHPGRKLSLKDCSTTEGLATSFADEIVSPTSSTINTKLEGESRCARPDADSAPEDNGGVESYPKEDGGHAACVVLGRQTSGTTKARSLEISGEALVMPCQAREEREGYKPKGAAEDSGRRAPATLPKKARTWWRASRSPRQGPAQLRLPPVSPAARTRATGRGFLGRVWRRGQGITTTT